MHNVKKISAEKRAAMRREDEERAARYNALSKAALARRAECLYDEESMDATERVLAINPEMTTLWNFRREVSISLRRWNHSYSPATVSKVPS